MIEDKKKRLPGVYLLPNLITTASLFSGFYSLIASINGEIITAVFAILIAMILDGLDGRIARLTNTQTSFGAYYDSLSDMICFGVAPAILLYIWSLSNFNVYGWHWSKIAWIICFIYVAAAALRLARFNSKNQTQDKKYFIDSSFRLILALVANQFALYRFSNSSYLLSEFVKRLFCPTTDLYTELSVKSWLKCIVCSKIEIKNL